MATKSVNRPAQTFLPSVRAVAELARYKEQVILYCSASIGGRGPRCAGWLQDHLDKHQLTKPKVKILEGGINAFVEQYGHDERLVTKLPVEVEVKK